jgi:hypothetical protein
MGRSIFITIFTIPIINTIFTTRSYVTPLVVVLDQTLDTV